MYRKPPSSLRSLHWYIEQLKFTLLALAAVIVPIAVSIVAASWYASLFSIGRTAFQMLCFFAVLIAEAFAYEKLHRLQPGTKGRERS